jgi:hypothetical protein
MNLTAKFCGQCGAPLRAGLRFCEQCGAAIGGQPAAAQPAGQAQPAPAAQPAPQGERVVGLIPFLRSGLFGQKSHTLVITDRRLIVAELTSKMIAEQTARIVAESKSRGEGLAARWGKQFEAPAAAVQRYYEMPPEQIVAENKGNWAAPLAQIQSCKLEERPNEDDSDVILTIKWSGGKSSFTLGPGAPSLEEARALLQQAGIRA